MVDRYSFSLTTFSPSGRLVQIEYALKAVESGKTSIGIKAKNGVVIATEKKNSILIDPKAINKVTKLTEKIGLVYSGMGPDSRVLIRRGRKIAQEYYRKYLDPIPVKEMVKELAAIMQEFTQQGGVRPFGVSLLVCGIDEVKGSQLFQIDPSGSYFGWKATAIGKNGTNARTFLEKRYTPELELEDAVNMAILCLREGFDGEITEQNIEIGVVDNKTNSYSILTPAQIKDYLD